MINHTILTASVAGYQYRNTACRGTTFARHISRPNTVDDVARYGTTSLYTPPEWLSTSDAWLSIAHTGSSSQ